MWALVILSFFQLCIFLTLATVWLILGAIVNPDAFLPFATAASTFVTVVSTKAKHFAYIATEGFEKVINFVKNVATKQLGGLLKKIHLTNSRINFILILIVNAKTVIEGGEFIVIANKAA